MNTIQKRQTNEKQALINQLKRFPIIQIACEKTGVGRTTYYRWRTEDNIFKNEADQAIREGEEFVSDIAESQLLSSIKNNNLTAIIFWLKHHHPSYKTKVEIEGIIKNEDNVLTAKQQEVIKYAIGFIKHKGGSKK